MSPRTLSFRGMRHVPPGRPLATSGIERPLRRPRLREGGRPGPSRMAGALVALAVVLTGWSAPTSLGAQSAATVPLWDVAYRDLDRLVGAGLVAEIFVGQRPYSERRFADFVGEAAAAAETGAAAGRPVAPALTEALERLRERFTGDGRGDGVEVVDVRSDVTMAESLARDTRVDTGRGLIDDRVNPLLAYRHGREVGHGGSAGLEASLRAVVGRDFAVEFRPRAQARHTFGPAGGFDDDFETGAGPVGGENAVEGETDFSTLRLYARWVVGNLAVAVGRDALVWAQGGDGVGLLLSTNARALDMLHVSNEAPVRLPWILGLIGPSRFAFFGSDLGEDQNFPHAKLFGAKWSARPWDRLELGVSYLNKQGGEGAPEASTSERIKDILFFPDVFDRESDFVFSEKIISGEMRWRLPVGVPTELYGEVSFTDFDFARFDQTLTIDAGYVGGLYFPALGREGRQWLRLEGQHTGATFYRHAQFHTGLTLDRQVMGTALGPDGESALVELGHVTARGDAWSLQLAGELRERDTYTIAENDPDLRAIKIAESPDEWRYRGVASWLGRFGPATTVEVRAGAERVDGWGFVEGDVRTFGFVGVVGAWRGW